LLVCSLASKQTYLADHVLDSSLDGRNHFSFNVKLQEDQDNMEEEVEEGSYDDEEYSLEYEVILIYTVTLV